MHLRHPTFGVTYQSFIRPPFMARTSIYYSNSLLSKVRFAPRYSFPRKFHTTPRTRLVLPNILVEPPGLSSMLKRKAGSELDSSNGHTNGKGATQQLNMKGLDGTTDLPPMDEIHAKQNAWSGPGPAAFDFRSTSLPSLYSFD